MNTSSLPVRIGLIVGAFLVLALVGLFITRMAVPNLVGSGQRAAQQTAVSQLRTILWTQDQMKTVQGADRDGDGVGEYAFLAQLSNSAPARTPKALTIPLLEGPLGKVQAAGNRGVAVFAAYCYAVFLPALGGGAVAEAPGGGEPGEPAGRVDPDGAERYWVAYAWPVDRSVGGTKVFYINQDEEIWEASASGIGHEYFGPGKGPTFDAALPKPDLSAIPVEGQPGGDGSVWKRWKNKQPRKKA